MPLCFIDPADAIRVVADSVGREARRQLLGEAVRAWVDEIPDDELEAHYAKAIQELDEHDISMLAAWHASMDIAHPIPNRDFLINAFGSLGQHRREALKLAAGFRGEEAVDRGLTEERALETVLEWLSPMRQEELAVEAMELYLWDRAGKSTTDRRLARAASSELLPRRAHGLAAYRLRLLDLTSLASSVAAAGSDKPSGQTRWQARGWVARPGIRVPPSRKAGRPASPPRRGAAHTDSPTLDA